MKLRNFKLFSDIILCIINIKTQKDPIVMDIWISFLFHKGKLDVINVLHQALLQPIAINIFLTFNQNIQVQYFLSCSDNVHYFIHDLTPSCTFVIF